MNSNTNEIQSKKQTKCKICNKKDFFFCEDCLKNLFPESYCFCEYQKSILDKNRREDYLKMKVNGCVNKNITIQSIKCKKYHQNNSFVFNLMMVFSESRILDHQSSITLISILPKITHLRLIYDTTKNGICPKNFHKCCNRVLWTLVVIRSEEGRIAGGYNDKGWEGEERKFSNTVFLFSVDNKRIYEIAKKEEAIYCSKNCFPVFGCFLIRWFFNQVVF